MRAEHHSAHLCDVPAVEMILGLPANPGRATLGGRWYESNYLDGLISLLCAFQNRPDLR